MECLDSMNQKILRPGGIYINQHVTHTEEKRVQAIQFLTFTTSCGV